MGECLARQQHQHGQLAAASSDAAAAEISNVKFVLTRSLEGASAEQFKLSWTWVLR